MELKDSDKEVFSAINKELARQRNGLEMIPSENIVSLPVLQALGSVFTNKYSEGYPKKRYYGGNEFVDEVELLAIERAKKLFGAEHVNVQPLSGSPANQAIYMALLEPGDKLMGLKLDHGGHLTHGHKVNFSGKLYHTVPYEVDKTTETLNYNALQDIAKKEKPKVIVAGFTAYPREINFKRFREIADESDSKLVVDMSHFAGLVAGKAHENPVPYADVVMTTTHKTLRGPRGAIIMCKEEFAKPIDKAVFPGLQGGPHDNVNAAKAVAFGEALRPAFKEYASQVVKNAKVLAEHLMKNGIRLVSGGTDTHLLLADLTKNITPGKIAETALDKAGIYVNKNTIPFEPRTPFDPSGIRLGTPTLTSRGMKEKEMELIAELIAGAIENHESDDKLFKIRERAIDLCSRYPIYQELGTD